MSPQEVLTRGGNDSHSDWFSQPILAALWNVADKIVGLEMYDVPWDTFAIEDVRNDLHIQAILERLWEGMKVVADWLWINSVECRPTLRKSWPKEAIIWCEIKKDGFVDKAATDALRIVVRKKWGKYFWPHLAKDALSLDPEVFIQGYLYLHRKTIEGSLAHLRPH